VTAVSNPVSPSIARSGARVAPFTPGVGGVVTTGDVDRLHDLAPGWVEQSFQLGRGPFEGSLHFGQTARMQFATKDWRPGLLVRGAAPQGTAVLGFPLIDSTAGRIRGMAMTPHDFGFIHSREEVDFRTSTAFKIFLIVMREEELEAYAEVVIGRPLFSIVRGNPRFYGGRSVEERQRDVERLGLDSVYRTPGKLADPIVAGWVENRILDSLLSGLPCTERRRPPGGMAVLARRAEDYLLTNLRAPLTIRDLCQAVGASERTLHLAFRQHLGTTPKAHLKALRLNAVRRDLRTAPPGTGVMDVAMRWGFFHAGWLSQDYRRMFGESPSTTLGIR